MSRRGIFNKTQLSPLLSSSHHHLMIISSSHRGLFSKTHPSLSMMRERLVMIAFKTIASPRPPSALRLLTLHHQGKTIIFGPFALCPGTTTRARPPRRRLWRGGDQTGAVAHAAITYGIAVLRQKWGTDANLVVFPNELVSPSPRCPVECVQEW